MLPLFCELKRWERRMQFAMLLQVAGTALLFVAHAPPWLRWLYAVALFALVTVAIVRCRQLERRLDEWLRARGA